MHDVRKPLMTTDLSGTWKSRPCVPYHQREAPAQPLRQHRADGPQVQGGELPLLSILDAAGRSFDIRGDMETGDGRSDITMRSGDPSRPSIVMELK